MSDDPSDHIDRSVESDCCGAPIMSGGMCADCKEHCEPAAAEELVDETPLTTVACRRHEGPMMPVVDRVIECSMKLEKALAAQTARADALEALNATMHERISGLVAEIAEAKEERDMLAFWKHQQLTVTAWWAEVDAAVRQHPESRLGESVSARALHLIRERDALVAGIEKLVADHAERRAFANTR